MSYSEDSDDYDSDVSDSDVSSLMYLLDEPALKISGKRLLKGLDIPHVKIPEGIEVIRQFAFLEFSNLISVHFPKSLINIQREAFYKCNGLKSVDLSSTRLTKIGERAFTLCTSIQSIQLPSMLNTIDFAVFHGCTGLTNVVFPVGLDNIGELAFFKCTNLTSVDLSQTRLSQIENGTFSRCTHLTSVKLPTSLTSIGNSAFGRCTHLTSMELPESLTSIGDRTFWMCTALRVLVPPCQVFPNAFSGCLLVVNASGNAITNSVVVDPRIIGLRKQLLDLWSQNVRRQGRTRQTGIDNAISLSTNMIDYETVQSNRERPVAVTIWAQIKQTLAGVTRRDEVVRFLFAKIFEGGRRLVQMKSYLNQPPKTKVFKQVLDDLGITEPFTKSNKGDKEIHVAKRMKRLQLRF